MRPASRAVAIVSVLAGTLVARSSGAYICTRVEDSKGEETGPSLSWFKRDVPYTFYDAGTTAIPRDETFATLDASFAKWVGVLECAATGRRDDIKFHGTATSHTDRIGYDFLHPDRNENLVIFRDDGWPLPGQNSTIALTTTTYLPLTGEILDADIEFNSANFAFAIDGSSNKMDLMNTAVHEIGHVLGLAHSNVTDSTMEPNGRYGETTKQNPHCDDRDGIVLKYPAGAPNGYCTPVASCGFCAPPDKLTSSADVTVTDADDDGRGGCAAAGRPALSALLLLGMLAARLRLVRRRPV